MSQSLKDGQGEFGVRGLLSYWRVSGRHFGCSPVVKLSGHFCVMQFDMGCSSGVVFLRVVAGSE